jgi:hypothetical protein
MGKEEVRSCRKPKALEEEEETWRRKDREDKDGDDPSESRDRQGFKPRWETERVTLSKEDREDTDEPQDRPAWIWDTRQTPDSKEERGDTEEAK